MFLPSSFLSFFTFHYLFRFLKHRKLGIRSIFKSYYVPYGIIVIIFIQNVNRLAFLACHNFTHLFSMNTQFYFIQGATVLFVGVMLFLTSSFYYIIGYLYGKKSKSIPVNLRRIKEQPTILFYSWVIRPII